jgi:hypothetical protein
LCLALAGRVTASNGAAVAVGGAGVVRLSATSLALQLVRERGIFGLYKGIGATAARDITFSVVYFPLFAHLNAIVSIISDSFF